MEDVPLALGERLECRQPVVHDELRTEVGVDVAASVGDLPFRGHELAV